MIDNAKRTSLKRLALASATAAAGLSGSSLALASSPTERSTAAASATDLPLANFEVFTRISATSNDVEVVIRNQNKDSVRVSQITPSETNTQRGRFDFAALTKKGDLTLAGGQSVSVPMTAHAANLNSPSGDSIHRQSLNKALRTSFSVITEGDAFARVEFVDGLRFA